MRLLQSFGISVNVLPIEKKKRKKKKKTFKFNNIKRAKKKRLFLRVRYMYLMYTRTRLRDKFSLISLLIIDLCFHKSRILYPGTVRYNESHPCLML